MQDEISKVSQLPKSIVTPSDISHLLRELSRLDEAIQQGEIRKAPLELKVKDISSNLHEILRLNNLDVLKSDDRQKGINYLNTISSKAPVIHFSFASEPNQDVTAKLVEWLRSQIHPLTLVVVGLVPGIGAGCFVRTTNKVFDFTLKSRLKENKQSLVNRIKEVASPAPVQSEQH